MQPFVSIAIPFYNAEEYLMDSIKAVFAQTYSKWELILIDDGSMDGSLDIAKSINDPRVSVYSDGKNKKLASRLNEIAKLARYDYLARMDADDIIAPEKLELQMKVLLDNPTLDLVTTGVVSVRNDLTYVGHRGQSANSVGLMDLVHKTKGVTHASILGKREWFLRNPYDETLKVAQDYSLWVTAAANNDFNIKLLEAPLYYYREEGNVKAKKMLLAYHYERRLYRKYVRGFVGKRLLIKSLLKSFLVRVLTGLGRMDVLLENRGTGKPNIRVVEKLQSDIAIINATVVPISEVK